MYVHMYMHKYVHTVLYCTIWCSTTCVPAEIYVFTTNGNMHPNVTGTVKATIFHTVYGMPWLMGGNARHCIFDLFTNKIKQNAVRQSFSGPWFELVVCPLPKHLSAVQQRVTQHHSFRVLRKALLNATVWIITISLYINKSMLCRSTLGIDSWYCTDVLYAVYAMLITFSYMSNAACLLRRCTCCRGTAYALLWMNNAQICMKWTHVSAILINLQRSTSRTWNATYIRKA